MKILELTNFSAGICGVWQRVKQESIELSKLGYKVKIFSSNATKGNNEIACSDEDIENISVNRFPFKKLGGESFMSWDFRKKALEYSPNIIIAHSYRHRHTSEALKIAEILKKQGKSCKVFLVTHAPFVEGDSTRSFMSKWAVRFYDFFIGKNILNNFDKVIAISNWEIPYLLKIGVKKEKLVVIPNGIPEEFFKMKKSKEENKIIFLGRVSPIKNLEVLIKAMKFIDIKLDIVGPAEADYKKELISLIKKEKVENKIKFSKPVYNIREKIKKIDSCGIFVLPSKKEGMPQSLIEAMAREKLVVGSDIPAVKDLVSDEKTGYLFKSNDETDLAKKINLALFKNSSKIKKQARVSVMQFSWNRIIKKITGLF